MKLFRRKKSQLPKNEGLSHRHNCADVLIQKTAAVHRAASLFSPTFICGRSQR